MEKKIMILTMIVSIICSIVSVVAVNQIPSNAVLYNENKTVDTVLDELYESVDAIESDNTRLTSLEGKVNALSSTHSSDITGINSSITAINNKIGTTSISSIGGGTITGAISGLNKSVTEKQNSTWTRIETVTGIKPVSIPSNCTELYVRVYVQIGTNYYISVGQFPIAILSNDVDVFYLTGGYSTSDKRLTRVLISTTHIQLSAVIQDDVNKIDEAVMTVWCR